MSRHGVVLYVSPGTALDLTLRALVEEWSRGTARWPYRSAWLADVEAVLAGAFPGASRADLNLTARRYAPFPLAAGHDVP